MNIETSSRSLAATDAKCLSVVSNSLISRGLQEIAQFKAGLPSVFLGDIHDAASRGDVEAVLKILDVAPAQVDAKTDGGWTPLHCAVCGGHVDVVALLLERGATVDAQLDGGDNRLLRAAGGGQLLLVDIGLTSGMSALHLAAFLGRCDCATLLLAAGADVHALDGRDLEPVDHAEDVATVTILGQHGGMSKASRRVFESISEEFDEAGLHDSPEPRVSSIVASLISKLASSRIADGLSRYTEFRREFLDRFGPEVTTTLGQSIERAWERGVESDRRGLFDTTRIAAKLLGELEGGKTPVNEDVVQGLVRVIQALVRLRVYAFGALVERVLERTGDAVTREYGHVLQRVWDEMREIHPQMQPSSDVAELLREIED